LINAYAEDGIARIAFLIEWIVYVVVYYRPYGFAWQVVQVTHTTVVVKTFSFMVKIFTKNAAVNACVTAKRNELLKMSNV